MEGRSGSSPCQSDELREERRKRKKEKREHKKLERSKTKVNKSEGSIAIVSRGFAEEINRRGDDDKHRFTIDISELMCTSVPKQIKTVKSQGQDVRYHGNPLDSARPTRSTGKHKEASSLKRLSKLKKEITAISAQEVSEYLNYHNNIITEDLGQKCENFISEVVVLQEKLYRRDPVKGDLQRRYIVGFHECKKYLLASKIKILIIATDIKVTEENNPLHKTIEEIVSLAENKGILYVFALKRRKLGKLSLKYLPVSCMGILNYIGANESYNILAEEVEKSKKAYLEQKSPKVNTVLLKMNEGTTKISDAVN